LNSFKYTSAVTNGLRHAKLLNKAALWAKRALRPLTIVTTNTAGRNNTGKLVCYTKGTRSTHRLRKIDHVKHYYSLSCKILRIEYDPTRSANIALVHYVHGLCTYRVSTFGLCIGDVLQSYFDIIAAARGGLALRFNIGDSSRLYSIPQGTTLHDVERYPGLGGSFSRAAGTFCILLRKFNGIRKCLLKIPSGLLLSISCYALGTKGIVCNKIHKHVSYGKAGRLKLLGNKSVVRGVAMNPVDHPHGGGEGKKSKKCFPRTAWGKMLFWRKTGVRYITRKRYS